MQVASRLTAFAAVALSMAALACAGPASTPSAPPTAGAPAPTEGVTAAPSVTASGLLATTTQAEVAPAVAITVAMRSFKFEPNTLAASAGTVSFFLRNDSDQDDPPYDQDHDLAIGTDLTHQLARSTRVKIGDSAVFTVQGLEAGNYTFWCTVPGHSYNGMVGTLTVTP